jgi:hypothetical protein
MLKLTVASLTNATQPLSLHRLRDDLLEAFASRSLIELFGDWFTIVAVDRKAEDVVSPTLLVTKGSRLNGRGTSKARRRPELTRHRMMSLAVDAERLDFRLRALAAAEGPSN